MGNADDIPFGICIGGLAMAIVCGIFLADVVTPDEWKKAEEFCSKNDGLVQINGYFLSQDFICKNGAVFNLKAKF